MVCERGGARRLWGAGAVSTVVCRAVWRERAEARVCRVCVKKTGRWTLSLHVLQTELESTLVALFMVRAAQASPDSVTL